MGNLKSTCNLTTLVFSENSDQLCMTTGPDIRELHVWGHLENVDYFSMFLCENEQASHQGQVSHQGLFLISGINFTVGDDSDIPNRGHFSDQGPIPLQGPLWHNHLTIERQFINRNFILWYGLSCDLVLPLLRSSYSLNIKNSLTKIILLYSFYMGKKSLT